MTGWLNLHKRNRLILALDIENLKHAVSIATLCSPYIDAIKIGLPLISTMSLNIINKLKKSTNLPIIADLKIADIGDIARKTVRAAFKKGADAITIWGFVGPTAIEICLEEAKNDKGVIVLTELTHPDAEFFMQPVAEKIVEMAKDLGVSGIQAPGTRPERIQRFREIVGDNMLIFACGIGAQGGEYGSAIKAGADFEIVGRGIYMDPNPEKVAQYIANRLKNYS